MTRYRVSLFGRYLLKAILTIAVLQVAGEAAAAPLASREELLLHQSEEIEVTFDAAKGEALLLLLEGAIQLPEGEAWGASALRITLNGESLATKVKPLNKPEQQLHPGYIPPLTTPLVDNDGYWWLKADSDELPCNPAPPHPLAYAHGASAADLYSLYHQYLFDITTLTRPGKNSLKIRVNLPGALAAFPVAISRLKILPRPPAILFARSWLETVYPWSMPRYAEWQPELSLAAARGEWEPCAFALHPLVPLHDLTVEVEAPSFGADCFDIRLVTGSPLPPAEGTAAPAKTPLAQHTLFGASEPGDRYCYAALPQPFTVGPGSTHSLVVIFQAPVTATAGIHKAEVVIRNGAEKIATLPLMIRIWPFELPDIDELPFTFGLFTMTSLPDPYDELSIRQLDDMAAHGVRTVMLGFRPQIRVEGDKPTVDLDGFARIMALWQKHGICQRYALAIHMPAKQVEKLGETELGEERFEKLYLEVIRQIVARADAEGWQLYLSPGDETNWNSFPRTCQLIELTKRVPGAKVWLTLTEGASAHYLYAGKLIGPEDIPLTRRSIAWHLDPDDLIHGYFTTPPVKAAWVQNEIFWDYVSLHETSPATATRARCGFSAWKGNMRLLMGFAYYWGDIRKPDGWRKEYRVTYPFAIDDERLYSTPVWEAVREGLDDYRYAQALYLLLAEKEGADEARKSVNELLQQIPLSADRAPATVDGNGFNQIRNTIAARIASEMEQP